MTLVLREVKASPVHVPHRSVSRSPATAVVVPHDVAVVQPQGNGGDPPHHVADGGGQTLRDGRFALGDRRRFEFGEGRLRGRMERAELLVEGGDDITTPGLVDGVDGVPERRVQGHP